MQERENSHLKFPNRQTKPKVHVSTITLKGKTKRTGTRRMEKAVAGYKKAIVKVRQGQKIGLFELGEESK